MNKLKLSEYERKRYVLKDKEDFIILDKIKEIEKFKLNNNDKGIVKLIRTQLERNWRKSLINYLNKIKKRYRK